MAKVLLTELTERLTWPGKKEPATRPSVYNYLRQLKIEPSYKETGNPPRLRACVTEKQAKLIFDTFKVKHWRKFEESPG